jgi:hypothetical protein
MPLQRAARANCDGHGEQQRACHHLDDRLDLATQQVRAVKCEHDQESEDDRQAHPTDQIRAELASRPRSPEQRDGGSQQSGVKRRDHRQHEHLAHYGVQPRDRAKLHTRAAISDSLSVPELRLRRA